MVDSVPSFVSTLLDLNDAGHYNERQISGLNCFGDRSHVGTEAPVQVKPTLFAGHVS